MMDLLLLWNLGVELSTCSDEDDVFEHKRGVRFLEPGEHETLSFVIEIL